MKKKLKKQQNKCNGTNHFKNIFKNYQKNDLSFDGKQINQCVFLGILRLKPAVPSIYINNNNNKQINKNISWENFDNSTNNKTRNRLIEIKLNMNKKEITSDQTIITENFNPVQNLFNKLKQQMDCNNSGNIQISKESLFSNSSCSNVTDDKKLNKALKENDSFTCSDTGFSSCSNTNTDDINLSNEDDTKSIRSSPRLKKTNTDSNTNEEIEITNKCNEKPRKRRTLLPAIPLNFFNTSMLLRSELAQKKYEKSDKKVKQEIINESTDDTNHKVEPLIIKLKGPNDNGSKQIERKLRSANNKKQRKITFKINRTKQHIKTNKKSNKKNKRKYDDLGIDLIGYDNKSIDLDTPRKLRSKEVKDVKNENTNLGINPFATRKRKPKKITIKEEIKELVDETEPDIILKHQTDKVDGKEKGKVENNTKETRKKSEFKIRRSNKVQQCPDTNKVIKNTHSEHNLDEVTMSGTNRSSVRALRSNLSNVVVKKEPQEEKPVAIIEKVVALIHSEPKPKSIDLEPEMCEKKPEIKPRVFKIENFNEIKSIDEVDNKSKQKKGNKRVNNKSKKDGISNKSKAINKNKIIKSKNLNTQVKKLNNNMNKKLIESIKTQVFDSVQKKRQKKALINNLTDDIIDKIIEHVKNTMSPNKKSKKHAKYILAKKKLKQIKCDIQRKLRNDLNKNLVTEEPYKEETTVHLVNGYLEEINSESDNKSNSIIILNDVTVHKDGKVIEKNSNKRKNNTDTDKINESLTHKKKLYTIISNNENEQEHKENKSSDKVFDFNESSALKKENTDNTIEESKLKSPDREQKDSPKKLWSVIEIPSSSTQEDTKANSEKQSPLKQTTIIEMFSKAWQKKDDVKKDLFLENNVFNPPKISPSDNTSTKEYIEDNDESDTESRLEWVPEEYAEYKLKYSVQKMMHYKPIFKCKICQLTMPSYYKLLKHKELHKNQDRPYVCPHCSSEFKEVVDFSAHLRVHKGKHPYMCYKCDMGFWTKKAYEDHALIHVLKKPKQSDKIYRCDVCMKEFSKLCDVERHTRVHTGEKPSVCNICNKGFIQPHNLSKHLLTHLHWKPFVCEICNKQFSRHDVLRRHLLTHSVHKPVNCSYCDKGFIRQSQLIQHLNKKHPEKVKKNDVEERVDNPKAIDEATKKTD